MASVSPLRSVPDIVGPKVVKIAVWKMPDGTYHERYESAHAAAKTLVINAMLKEHKITDVSKVAEFLVQNNHELENRLKAMFAGA